MRRKEEGEGRERREGKGKEGGEWRERREGRVGKGGRGGEGRGGEKKEEGGERFDNGSYANTQLPSEEDFEGQRAKDLHLNINCSSETDKREADVPLWRAILLV